MSIRQFVAAVLLSGGVGIALLCCIGVLALNDAFDRLHFITSANTLSTGLIALAVAVGKPFSNTTMKTILLLIMMIISGPILSHATARALRIRRHGEWRILPEEVHESPPGSEKEGGSERGRPDHEAVARRFLSKIVPVRDRGENEESQG